MLPVLHPAKVKGKGPHLDHRTALPAGPAELGIHPGPEDGQGEGLGDVVLRPQFQPGHDVGLPVVGGEEDHRQPAPDLLQKRQAAAVGEVHVQDGQGKGPLPFQRLPGLGQGAAEGHRPVLSLQGQANPLAQGQVIFY